MKTTLMGLSRLAVAMACATAVIPSIAADRAASATQRPAAGKDVERGRYLVLIAGCNDCHTRDFLTNGGKTPEKDRLTGSTMGWRGPWGTTYPPNLRLYFQDLTEEQWVQEAREIQRRPPMPYFSLNAMKEADVRAIYRYIRHLGPDGTKVPEFVPPGKEPAGAFVSFPAN